MGLPFAFWKSSASSLFLDDFNSDCVGAFSLRLLSSTYSGACLKAYRYADGVEQDINFLNGYIDEAAVVTFANGGSTSVSIWYDQNTSGNNLFNNSVNNRYRLTNNSGAMYYNGTKAYLYEAGRWQMITSNFMNITNSPASLLSVFYNPHSSITQTQEIAKFSGNSGSDKIKTGENTTGIFSTINGFGTLQSTIASDLNSFNLVSMIADISPNYSRLYKGTTEIDSTNTVTSLPNIRSLRIPTSGSSLNTFDGAEFFFYTASKQADINGMQTNIMSYYDL